MESTTPRSVILQLSRKWTKAQLSLGQHSQPLTAPHVHTHRTTGAPARDVRLPLKQTKKKRHLRAQPRGSFPQCYRSYMINWLFKYPLCVDFALILSFFIMNHDYWLQTALKMLSFPVIFQKKYLQKFQVYTISNECLSQLHTQRITFTLVSFIKTTPIDGDTIWIACWLPILACLVGKL